MAPEEPIIGRTLGGRFRVTAFIGEGGMASVYRAVQDAEPRDVALKILHPHLVSDATFVGRFRREARAAARIVHPASVRIIDTGVDGKLLYIAMELLGGQDLFELLVLERRLPEARAVRIVAQVADALSAAHEKGVVHRDLKPENIMLLVDDDHPEREEQVKVLDFGIAKILERDVKTSSDALPSMQTALTAADTVVGTPAYMSPEQCRGEELDHRSDIYACGVLLYQLVSGRLPFTAASTMEVAVMHVRTPPMPLTSIVPAVNRELAALVLQALSKWPNERPASAAALRDRLLALLPDLATTKLVVGEAPSAPEAEPAPDSSRLETRAAASVKDAVTPPAPPAEDDAADRDTLAFEPEPPTVPVPPSLERVIAIAILLGLVVAALVVAFYRP